MAEPGPEGEPAPGPAELLDRARDAARRLRLAEAERLLRRCLDRLGSPTGTRRPAGEGPSHRRVLLTLAYVRAERGHLDEGIALLGAPEFDDCTGHDAGLVRGQRGLLLLRAGRLAEARDDLDAAVRMLEAGSVERVQTLLNRGLLGLAEGRLTAARRDVEECLRATEELDLPALRGQALHNIGWLAFLAGDLPRALHDMDRAAAVLSRWGDLEHVYRVDRARVLQAGGLFEEADEELGAALATLTGSGRHQDLAEAELYRAQIAQARGDHPRALVLARRARSRFARRGSSAWELVARLAEARARTELGVLTPSAVTALDRLGGELRAAGLAEDARSARITAARARLARGEPAAAAAVLPAPRAGEGVLNRLALRELRADLATVQGDAARAGRELRQGLRELHAYQASLGSLDLQTAVTAHGRALAARGLAAAVAEGRPGRVFAWSERARALASRLPVVLPPSDPDAAALLGELRFLRAERRRAELAGRDEPALRARCADLERRVRQRSWYASGPGSVAAEAGYRQVRASLGGSCLVAHLIVGDGLHVLVVTAEGGRLLRLGPAAAVLEALRLVRADLDALALAGLPETIRQVVRRGLRSRLAALGDRLWEPLSGLSGAGPVVLVPSGPLVAVPWGLLPGLAGRPVTVARSATAWLRERSAGPWRRPGRVVLAAGPDLGRAGEEVRSAARLWPGARVLDGTAATTGAVLGAVIEADLLHLAAHGSHEASGPLFSALRLADGPLFGYDLQRAGGVPAHVVLSACDLGRVSERPGDEVLGMTAVLLQAGARAVVASVARVGDSVACEVGLAHHEALQAGASPAEALALAVRGRDDAPFVCFGAG